MAGFLNQESLDGYDEEQFSLQDSKNELPQQNDVRIAMYVVLFVAIITAVAVYEMFTSVDIGETLVVQQAITGHMRVLDEPGLYMTTFGKITRYPTAESIQQDISINCVDGTPFKFKLVYKVELNTKQRIGMMMVIKQPDFMNNFKLSHKKWGTWTNGKDEIKQNITNRFSKISGKINRNIITQHDLVELSKAAVIAVAKDYSNLFTIQILEANIIK